MNFTNSTQSRIAATRAAPLFHPRLATAAGVADCLPVFGYVFDTSPYPFYLAALAIKFVLIFGFPVGRQQNVSIVFVLAFASLSLISSLASPYFTSESIIQIVAFSASLFLSTLIVGDEERLKAYAKGIANTLFVLAVLYLLAIVTGRIPNQYGRFFYFSGSHPNLGSEVNAIAVIVTCIFFRWKSALLRFPILFAPMLLMQGRAAMAASLLAIGILLLQSFRHSLRRNPLLFIVAAIAFLSIFALTSLDQSAEFLNKIFLVDDPYRGADTGFVGRTDRWAQAIALFWERPFLGNGASAVDTDVIPSPHNYFLYGLVNLGLSFTVILGVLIYNAARAWRRAPEATQILSPVIVLMIFNDRFANLNPYPFEFYVVLLGLSMLPLRLYGEGPIRPSRKEPYAGIPAAALKARNDANHADVTEARKSQ